MLTVLLAAGMMRSYVVAYIPNWIDLSTYAATIDYAKLTHINIAFENPADDAGNLSFNPSDDILIKTAHEKGIKVLISIGGGGAPEDKKLVDRYVALTSATQRTAFVAKLADYLDKHHFDGLDVDLEGPMIGPNYGGFIDELAKVLKPRHKLLTSALSKGYGGENVPATTFAAFDFVNVMAYDATGPWAPTRPGQHSSMEYAKENVDYWIGRGLPKSKTVLGLPFYGYGFGKDAMGDEWSYAKILAAYPGAEKTDQVGTTIYYNGVATIKAKTKYAMNQGLAGVMIWSLNSDVAGENSLLSAIHKTLNP